MNTNTAQWFNYIRLRRLLSHLYCAAVIIIQGLHIIMWFDSINPGSTVTLTVNFLLSTPLRVWVCVQPSRQWCCTNTDEQLILVVVLTTLINTYTPLPTNGVKIPSTIHVGHAFLKGRLPVGHQRWWPYQQLIYTLLSLQNYSQESFGEWQMSKNKHTKSCTGLKKTRTLHNLINTDPYPTDSSHVGSLYFSSRWYVSHQENPYVLYPVSEVSQILLLEWSLVFVGLMMALSDPVIKDCLWLLLPTPLSSTLLMLWCHSH